MPLEAADVHRAAHWSQQQRSEKASCELVFVPHLKCDSLSVWMCRTGDPLYIVKIVIGPIICFVLLLCVAVAGFVMFKKKYVIITSCSVLSLIFSSLYFVGLLINVLLLFLSVKLRGQVVPFTPLLTQSISVLMMVSNFLKPFYYWPSSWGIFNLMMDLRLIKKNLLHITAPVALELLKSQEMWLVGLGCLFSLMRFWCW